MIPMEYLSADIRGYNQINPTAKGGQSTNRNRFIKRNLSESKRKMNTGPAAILHLGEPANTYIYKSSNAIGVPNIVTSVLASYRGYDTLGETVVIFTAGIGVLLLLRRSCEMDQEGKTCVNEESHS